MLKGEANGDMKKRTVLGKNRKSAEKNLKHKLAFFVCFICKSLAIHEFHGPRLEFRTSHRLDSFTVLTKTRLFFPLARKDIGKEQKQETVGA